MPNGTTTTAGRLAVAALTNLNPYIALLVSSPGEFADPTSGEILAVECTMTGYQRLLVTNWQQNLAARPPFSFNFDEVATTSPVSGTPQTITHFALVQNPSGATGTIYSVGQLVPAFTLTAGENIVIGSGKARVIAGPS
jgi:hypothetical protein